MCPLEGIEPIALFCRFGRHILGSIAKFYHFFQVLLFRFSVLFLKAIEMKFFSFLSLLKIVLTLWSKESIQMPTMFEIRKKFESHSWFICIRQINQLEATLQEVKKMGRKTEFSRRRGNCKLCQKLPLHIWQGRQIL